jgi:hypothetical protein
MGIRKLSNSSISNGEKATSFTGEPGVTLDAADAYYSNLKIWIRGGHNGATAGNINAGITSIDVPSWNSTAGTVGSIGTVQRVDNSGNGSPVNSAVNKFIKDGKAGNTAILRNDKLAFYFNGSSTIWKALDTATWNTSTTNRTMAYWMRWDDVSANTSTNLFSPTFHSWSGTNSVGLIAHDWYTNGTGNPYMSHYGNGAFQGDYVLPNLAGGSNGNKGVWFHIAVVYTASALRIYLNGKEQSHSVANLSWLTPGSSQAFNFNGRGDGISGGNPGNYTSGYTGIKYMADIRYYDTNLSSDAVLALYNKAGVYYN